MVSIFKLIKFICKKKKEAEEKQLAAAAKKSKGKLIGAVIIAAVIGLAAGAGIGFFLAKSDLVCKKCSCKKDEVECEESNVLSREDYE